MSLPFIIFSHTFKEFAKPILSVDPWLLITGLSKPNKIAPLYNLGSNLFLNFFKFLIFNSADILPIKDEFNAFFSSSVMKFAVPSAVFKAIFHVKPSVTITLTFPSII